MACQLAQLNIARWKIPPDSEGFAEFNAALEPINALADASPGFVWRLQTEDGDAMSIRAFDDDRMLINMSVWESIDRLREFVYRSNHAAIMRRRREWFERLETPMLTLWWVPAGHIPTLDDAKERLEHLETHGPTEHAFTFRHVFPEPAATQAGHG